MRNIGINMFQSRYLRIATGIAISIGFLLIAFYKIQLSQFRTALQHINIFDVVLCVFFFGLSCIFRALMWRITTRMLGAVRLSNLFGGVIVGYMANNILPLRAGELMRTYYLNARTGISASSALSTIFIERIYDVLSLALFLVIGVVFGIQGLASNTAKIILAVLGAITLISAIILLYLSRLNGLEQRFNYFSPKILHMIEKFFKPLSQLKQANTLIILLMLNIGAWISNYLSMLALIHWLPSVYFKAALLLLLFINIGILIPSSPGAIGVMQVAFWAALAPFDVVKENALALSFAYQVGLYLFTLAIGLPYFLKTKLHLRLLQKS